MSCSIIDINQMDKREFVARLGAVFEETPAIAEQTWAARPFSDISALHSQMVAVVEKMSGFEQLDLIRAHPELAARSPMAAASVQEQASTGLNQLSPQEYERFQSLNSAYKEKFGFPFVMAVKGHDKNSILAMFGQRLENGKEEERARSLAEIHKIARFRLEDLID